MNEIIITLIAFLENSSCSMNKLLTSIRGMNGRIVKLSRILQRMSVIFQRRSNKKGQRFHPTKGKATTVIQLR